MQNTQIPCTDTLYILPLAPHPPPVLMPSPTTRTKSQGRQLRYLYVGEGGACPNAHSHDGGSPGRRSVSTRLHYMERGGLLPDRLCSGC
jgi:hypothetical protein